VAEKETVAFIGLGHAGWNMAGNVLAGGFGLIASDIDPERERRFCAEHPGALAAAETGFSEAGVVITSLPNGQVVREALIDSGVAATLARGTIVVDMSSSAPAGTLELGEELSGLGLVLVDAPVSMPTLDGAWSRGLTLMVGGNDEAALDHVQPILESMSENVFRVGPLGAGHAVKTLNNYVGSAGYVAALDALVVGARYGLDPETMLDVFNASTARNFATASPLKQEALTRRFATGFQIGLFVKDLGIANDLIDQLELESPLARVLRELMAEARDDLGYDADSSEALKFWEKKSGVTVPNPSGQP
jgi:3-hydroxyisobutyrate dehydrogenase